MHSMNLIAVLLALSSSLAQGAPDQSAADDAAPYAQDTYDPRMEPNKNDAAIPKPTYGPIGAENEEHEAVDPSEVAPVKALPTQSTSPHSSISTSKSPPSSSPSSSLSSTKSPNTSSASSATPASETSSASLIRMSTTALAVATLIPTALAVASSSISSIGQTTQAALPSGGQFKALAVNSSSSSLPVQPPQSVSSSTAADSTTGLDQIIPPVSTQTMLSSAPVAVSMPPSSAPGPASTGSQSIATGTSPTPSAEPMGYETTNSTITKVNGTLVISKTSVYLEDDNNDGTADYVEVKDMEETYDPKDDSITTEGLLWNSDDNKAVNIDSKVTGITGAKADGSGSNASSENFQDANAPGAAAPVVSEAAAGPTSTSTAHSSSIVTAPTGSSSSATASSSSKAVSTNQDAVPTTAVAPTAVFTTSSIRLNSTQASPSVGSSNSASVPTVASSPLVQNKAAAGNGTVTTFQTMYRTTSITMTGQPTTTATITKAA